MSTAAKTAHEQPTLHPEFVEKMVRTFNDSAEHGVHLLFNEWWRYAPEETIERYLQILRAIPGADSFLAERYIAEPNTPYRYPAHNDPREERGGADHEKRPAPLAQQRPD